MELKMKRTTVLGGTGGIAFGVLTFVALFLASPIGGNYKASDAASYVAQGHRPVVFVSLYLVLVGVLGLICLLVRLREAIDVTGSEQAAALNIFWGTGLAAATCFAVGWSVIFSVPMTYAYSVSGFSIGPTEAYAITQAGGIVLYGAAGILLGFALIALGVGGRAALPAWMRWLTLVVGVLGLASPGFFPWFALPIWAIVAGVWLLASARAPVEA
jgi:hypothetical protein